MHDPNDTTACLPTEKTGRLMADALRACKEYIGIFHDSKNRRAPTIKVYYQARAALEAYEADKAHTWNGDIYLQIANDRDQLSRVMAAVRRLFVEIDIAADRCAKARADWHDDPEGDPEGHAAAHAPAAEQYPEADRYRAAISLLDYFANEYRRPELTDAAYDRAQQPKPKGAPGRCPVCRHYGIDCTCHRRKGARHVRG